MVIPAVEEHNDNLPKKWEVTARLGSGGQGAVFMGEIAGVPAAVKLFYNDGEAQRVAREVDALCKLDCNHLVHTLGSCTATVNGEASSLGLRSWWVVGA